MSDQDSFLKSIMDLLINIFNKIVTFISEDFANKVLGFIIGMITFPFIIILCLRLLGFTVKGIAKLSGAASWQGEPLRGEHFSEGKVAYFLKEEAPQRE